MREGRGTDWTGATTPPSSGTRIIRGPAGVRGGGSACGHRVAGPRPGQRLAHRTCPARGGMGGPPMVHTGLLRGGSGDAGALGPPNASGHRRPVSLRQEPHVRGHLALGHGLERGSWIMGAGGVRAGPVCGVPASGTAGGGTPVRSPVRRGLEQVRVRCPTLDPARHTMAGTVNRARMGSGAGEACEWEVPRADGSLEIRLNVVLGGPKPGLEGGAERVWAHLHETGGSAALLDN